MKRKIKKRWNTKNRLTVVFDFIGIIILWRGVWGLMDLFLFPNQPLYSYGASILLGIVLVFIDGDGVRDISR